MCQYYNMLNRYKLMKYFMDDLIAELTSNYYTIISTTDIINEGDYPYFKLKLKYCGSESTIDFGSDNCNYPFYIWTVNGFLECHIIFEVINKWNNLLIKKNLFIPKKNWNYDYDYDEEIDNELQSHVTKFT